MTKYNLKSWLHFRSFLIILMLVPFRAQAELKVDITQGKIEPLPIAISDFFGDDERSRGLGQDIARVVGADLERSGLFRLIDPKAFIQGRSSLRVRPQFPSWRQINARR